MRNLPASVKARWWAGWRGPPCWQAQDGWPQRLWTKVRVAARTGPLGTICLRRLLIMRLDDGQLAWHVHSNPRGSLVYSNYTRKSAEKPWVRRKNCQPRQAGHTSSVKTETCSCKGATNPLFVRAGPGTAVKNRNSPFNVRIRRRLHADSGAARRTALGQTPSFDPLRDAR